MTPALEDHPIASCWPLMSDTEIAELATSIRSNGQRLAITLHEGKILDGRNRYRACQQVHVKPWTVVFDGTDPVQFAKDINEQRRHQTKSQRAMVARKLANIQVGDNQYKKEGSSNDPPSSLVSIPEAAEVMKVSPAHVKRAGKVLKEAAPEVVAKVEAGEMTVGAALKTITVEVETPKPKPRRFKSVTKGEASKHKLIDIDSVALVRIKELWITLSDGDREQFTLWTQIKKEKSWHIVDELASDTGHLVSIVRAAELAGASVEAVLKSLRLKALAPEIHEAIFARTATISFDEAWLLAELKAANAERRAVPSSGEGEQP